MKLTTRGKKKPKVFTQLKRSSQPEDWSGFNTTNTAWGPNTIVLSLYLIENLSHNKLKSLEAGCGSGKWSLILTEQGYSPVLLDNNRGILMAARDRFKQHNKQGFFVQADINKLPFREGTFDACFNDGTMEHFNREDRRGIISEMSRVVNNGGIVAVGTPNKWNPFQHIFNLFGENKEIDEELISPAVLKQDLADSGLEVKRYGSCVIFSLLLLYHAVRGLAATQTLSRMAEKFGPDLISMHRRMSGLFIIRLLKKFNWLDKYFGEELFYIGIRKKPTSKKIIPDI